MNFKESLVECGLLRGMGWGHKRQYTPTHDDVIEDMIMFADDASIKATIFLLVDQLMGEFVLKDEKIESIEVKQLDVVNPANRY